MPGYFSEIRYEGGETNDFIEIVVPTGTDTSAYSVAIYDKYGVYLTSVPLGAVDATIPGSDVYVIGFGDAGFPDIKHNFTLGLIDDTGTVVQLLALTVPLALSGGPADGMTGTSSGLSQSLIGESIQTDDEGTTYYIQTVPNPGTIPCYAPGTLIDTPDGPRAVETLQIGDLVETLDHGPQAIHWTSCRTHPLEEADTDAKPVQIKAGALGRSLPTQDMIVSPQHRILVGGAGQLQQVFASQAFAPAKSLTSVPGIRHMKGKKEITWVHFACDRYEVVTANGCLSESLLLGPMVVNGLTAAERQAVTDIFGAATTPDAALNGPPARECLTVGAVKRQIAKHLKEKGQLLAKEIRNWDRDLAMEKYEAERLREAASLAHSREKALRLA